MQKIASCRTQIQICWQLDAVGEVWVAAAGRRSTWACSSSDGVMSGWLLFAAASAASLARLLSWAPLNPAVLSPSR